jgi:hypothetical protein
MTRIVSAGVPPALARIRVANRPQVAAGRTCRFAIPGAAANQMRLLPPGMESEPTAATGTRIRTGSRVLRNGLAQRDWRRVADSKDRCAAWSVDGSRDPRAGDAHLSDGRVR